MNRDEFERLKNEEKAHLRKVRALKQQLREANRKKGLLNALEGLDTSGLDSTHEEMLQKLTEKNITSEARFELAMDTLDDAAKQEAAREEMARLEADRTKSDAADLVRQMKAQMLGDAAEHVEAQRGDAATDAAPAEQEEAAAAPTKTIGPVGESADDTDAPEPTGKPAPDAPESSAPPARTIGRFGRDDRGRDTERD
jgi:hypothetical protein